VIKDRQAQESEALAWAINEKGIGFLRSGDLEKAMALFREEEQMSRRVKSGYGLLNSLIGQMKVSINRRHLCEATSTASTIKRLAQELGDQSALVICLGYEAHILGQRGDLDGALERLRDQEELHKQAGELRSADISRVNQANVLRKMRDSSNGLVLLDRVEKSARETGDQELLAYVLAIQADTFSHDLQSSGGTQTKALEAIHILTQADLHPKLLEYCRVLLESQESADSDWLRLWFFG
jgi:hypothetical protein